MVEETIKTIKETENKADEIIRKADTTCTESRQWQKLNKRQKQIF